MKPKRSKIIGYARSSLLLEMGGAEDIAHQRRSIHDHSNRLDVELLEVIEEQGDSGSSFIRPGLSRLIEMIDEGKADGVIVYDLGRLCREQADFFALYRRYFGSRGGHRLIAVIECIDTAAFTDEIDDIVWFFASLGIDEIAEYATPPEGCVGNAIRRMKFLGVEAASCLLPHDGSVEDLIVINLDNGGGRSDDLVQIGITPEEATELLDQLAEWVGEEEEGAEY